MTTKPCPHCGATGTLDITVTAVDVGVTATPLGDFSLSGSQMKFAARTHATGAATITCTGCGWTRQGRLEDATWDADGVATGGHLVIDPDPT